MAHGTVSPAVNLPATKRSGAQGFETLAVAVLLGVAGYAALFVAPTEATMGLVQRIFYFHMPFGITSFVSFAISFIASLAYLRNRAPKWDRLAVASAEVVLGLDCSMSLSGVWQAINSCIII